MMTDTELLALYERVAEVEHAYDADGPLHGLRAVAAAAWREGAEALAGSFWDGEAGVPGQNPYALVVSPPKEN